MIPTKQEIAELLEEYDVVPVFKEFLSDSIAPVQIFSALKHSSESCFILESVDNTQNWGRYSFIGINPKMEIKIKDGKILVVEDGNISEVESENPIAYLQSLMDQYRSPNMPNHPKLTGGLVGYFGYDMVRYIEKKLSNPPKDDLMIPDSHLFLFDEIVAYDHLSNKIAIILNIMKGGDLDQKYEACLERAEALTQLIQNHTPVPNGTKQNGPCTISSNLTKEEFMANVQQAKKYIAEGDIFQVVLSQRFEADNAPDAFDVYRMLRVTNPSPYLFYLHCKDYQIAGASPEMLVNVTKGIVTTKPIAGTMPRGETDAEDIAYENKMVADPKERAEHTMLVDLGRNDVGKVSKFGTVEVTRFMEVEYFSKVMHLVSDVKGILRDDKTALDALMAVLPAGTLSGAPKIKAMEIIDELETEKRGLYGGTVGYLGFDGNIDTCIAIRTALFKDGKAYVQAGGGIVADSVPESEYMESCNKAQAVLNAIKEAATL